MAKNKKQKIPEIKRYLVELSEVDAEYLRVIARRKGISRFQYMSQQLSQLAQRERTKAMQLFKPDE